jgi:biotin carboxyl carrier protein
MELTKWKMDGTAMTTSGDAVRLQWENATFFSLEHNGHTFHGEVISNRMEEGLLTIKLNHRVFEIRKEGPLDELIASLGLDKPKVRKLKQLKAPMPGRVVSVAVAAGDEVNPGDPLLTLEAMKMENVLKAEGTGVVKKISVASNDVVDKGALLIEFE